MKQKIVAQVGAVCVIGMACWLVYDRVSGPRVSLTPDVFTVQFEDSRDPDAEMEGYVEILNSSGETVRLLGVSPSCGCVHLGKWPAVLPPRQAARISWNVRKDGFSSDQEIRVFTDCRSVPVLVQDLRLASSSELQERK